jgi:hypothetical protein
MVKINPPKIGDRAAQLRRLTGRSLIIHIAGSETGGPPSPTGNRKFEVLPASAAQASGDWRTKARALFSRSAGLPQPPWRLAFAVVAIQQSRHAWLLAGQGHLRLLCRASLNTARCGFAFARYDGRGGPPVRHAQDMDSTEQGGSGGRKRGQLSTRGTSERAWGR